MTVFVVVLFAVAWFTITGLLAAIRKYDQKLRR